MQDIITNLTSAEWFGTLVAFLTANFGVLLTLVISVIRLRIKNIDKDKVITECMKVLNETVATEVADRIERHQEALVAKMDKLEAQVVSKIGDTEAERARLIQAQSVELSSKLEALKAQYGTEE